MLKTKQNLFLFWFFVFMPEISKGVSDIFFKFFNKLFLFQFDTWISVGADDTEVDQQNVEGSVL